MATVGEQLRAAREQKKLTIEQLADQSKIRGDHLRALEAGDYEVFSAPVYVRGFTRTYSNLLKLNTREILEQLDRELGKVDAFKDLPSSRVEEPRGLPLWALLSRVNWPAALALVILVVIATIVVTVVRRHQAEARRDVVRELGPGLYQPKEPARGQYLPPPTNLPGPQQAAQ